LKEAGDGELLLVVSLGAIFVTLMGQTASPFAHLNAQVLCGAAPTAGAGKISNILPIGNIFPIGFPIGNICPIGNIFPIGNI
jgi:hypothetical protein